MSVAAAIFLAQCGANLILACRSPPPHERHPNDVVQECKTAAKSRGYEKSTIEWWQIDMTKLATVDEFAARYLETGRPLDLTKINTTTGLGMRRHSISRCTESGSL